MTPTQTTTLPHTCTDVEHRRSATGSRVCVDGGMPAHSGHRVAPRPEWVQGKPAAGPTTTL